MSERARGREKQGVNLYEVVLTPGEADAYFKKAQDALEVARRSPYGNVVDRLRGRLGKNAHERLADSIGVLLPLCHQQCVQNGETEVATIEGIQTMVMDTMTFIGGFRGSGVKILGPDEIVPKMTSMLKGEKS